MLAAFEKVALSVTCGDSSPKGMDIKRALHLLKKYIQKTVVFPKEYHGFTA